MRHRGGGQAGRRVAVTGRAVAQGKQLLGQPLLAFCPGYSDTKVQSRGGQAGASGRQADRLTCPELAVVRLCPLLRVPQHMHLKLWACMGQKAEGQGGKGQKVMGEAAAHQAQWAPQG